MRGQRPKSTERKIADGNPGKRPLNSASTAPTTKERIPDPQKLPRISMHMYREVRWLLRKMGIEDRASRYQVELLALAYWEWRQASDYVRKHGQVYEVATPGGVKRMTNPEVKIAADAWRRVKSGLEELGLTPSAAIRFSQKSEENELDHVLRKMAERSKN